VGRPLQRGACPSTLHRGGLGILVLRSVWMLHDQIGLHPLVAWGDHYLLQESLRTHVPPKIKVFLWQLIRNRLPPSVQVAKRNGPSDGLCSLCHEPEDCNHIFFLCPMARFMWAGVRELLQCDWNPGGAGDFIALANGLSGPYIG
jgi:hypothetical protein